MTFQEIASIILCPISGKTLQFINGDERWPEGYYKTETGIIYPIKKGIILLLKEVAILPEGLTKTSMSFDKKRVFDYYNEIGYEDNDSELSHYEDSKKFVDYSETAYPYFKNSFQKAGKYLPAKGKYFLDIASGPIGNEEYLGLSKNYDYRICIDISFNALLQAKRNLKQKGIFICGDITCIPLVNDLCDVVVSHHTLYHVPKNEQAIAVKEMYRVTGKGGKTIIIYNWFFYSMGMNILLLPVQFYRILRHFLGKWYVRIVKGNPKLYYHVFPPSWWYGFPFSGKMKIFCWRFGNHYFARMYIHKSLFGAQLVQRLIQLEEKYPQTMGKLGDYPIIVIEKD